MIILLWVIISAGLVAFSRRDLHASFTIFLVLRIFLNHTIGLSAIPGMPNLQLEMLLTIYYIVEYTRRYKSEVSSLPLFIPVCIMLASMAISSFLTESTLKLDLPRTFNTAVKTYGIVFPIALYVSHAKTRELRLLAYCLFAAILVLSIYSAYCVAFEQNPLISAEMELVGEEYEKSGYVSGSDPRGVRYSSVFLHPIGAGANCVYLAALAVIMFQFVLKHEKFRYLLLLSAIMGLAFTILQAKSRTPIVGLGFVFMLFLSFDKKNWIYMVALLLIGAAYVLTSDVSVVVKSLYSSDAMEDVGGSNPALRYYQLLATIQVVYTHPLFGLGGMGFDTITDVNLLEALYGIESIWFLYPISYGLVGTAALAYLFYSMASLKTEKNHTGVLLITAAYVVMNTLSSIPDQKDYLLFLALLLYVRFNSSTQECMDKLVAYVLRVKLIRALIKKQNS